VANGFGDMMRAIRERLPALSHRDFRLLWLGQIVSISGSQMQAVAISWHIYQKTNSPEMLGLVGMARVVPIIIFSLFGGATADSFNRKKIMFITQTVMMSGAVMLALATDLGYDTPLFLLAATSLGAAASAFDNPARQSLIPNLVPPEHLTSAISLNTMMFQTSMIVGPALAGFLLKNAGGSSVYWINAMTFVAVIGALLLMRVDERPSPGRAAMNVSSLFEGLRFVRKNELILSTMLLDFFATFFASATALLPIYARDILKVDADGLGFLYSAEAVGSLLAGFGMSMLVDIRRKGHVLLLAVAFYGVATAIYGLSTNFLLSLVLLALVGAGDSVSTVLRSTIRNLVTPDYIRGRMTAVNMVFFMGGPQLGNLEAGLLAGMIGAPMAVVSGGIATVAVVAFTAWRFRGLRQYGTGTPS
jgi:MFS family permease